MDQLQEQAISHVEGSCAVIAGPGSGKTAVITGRAKRLSEGGLIKPAQLLTITFTRAAAYEMQNRFLKLTSGLYQEAAFGTFHAVFYQMIVQSGMGEPVSFIGLREKRAMMEQVLKERALRFSVEVTESLLRAVSRVKNMGNTALKNMVVAADVPYAERFAELFHAYEEIRKSLNRMDYDDIAPACLSLLENNEGLLQRWQDRFRFIQIDEFQDVNAVQYELAVLLAGKRKNLFVVGDDDQSIYGFRGAEPDMLRQFLRDFPDAKRIALKTNFRSSRAVIRASERVIKGAQNRMEKQVIPAEPASDGYYAQSVYPERKQELQALAGQIRSLGETGTAYERMAVLCRTASDAARCAQVLGQALIPFMMTGKMRIPFTESTAEDVLAYLRFAVFRDRRSDFLRILNKPVRYLSRGCAAGETVREEDVLAYYAGNDVCTRKVRRLFLHFHRIAHLKTRLAIGYVLQATGYEHYLRTETDAEGYRKALEEIDRLKDLAETYTDIRSFLLQVESLQETVRESAGGAAKNATGKKGVRIMTMHASKGLEFDAVFLPFLNEGNLPLIRAVTDAETEEERRLLYVAMTRARERLYVSCSEKDGSKRLIKSRFLV